MVSAGISVEPSFEASAHPPQQKTQRTEYQNHLALSVASDGIVEIRSREESELLRSALRGSSHSLLNAKGQDIVFQPTAERNKKQTDWSGSRTFEFLATTPTSAAGVSDPEGRFGLTAQWNDLDGDVDLVVENIGGAPMILRNEGGNQNN